MEKLQKVKIQKLQGHKTSLSKCAVYDSKKSKFSGKEVSGLLSSLEIRSPLSKIALLGPLLF